MAASFSFVSAVRLFDFRWLFEMHKIYALSSRSFPIIRRGLGRCMKLVSEYLADAAKFVHLATLEKNPGYEDQFFETGWCL